MRFKLDKYETYNKEKTEINYVLRINDAPGDVHYLIPLTTLELESLARLILGSKGLGAVITRENPKKNL